MREVRKGNGKVQSLEFWRKTFSLFRDLLVRIPWETALEVKESWYK